jgi:hypothetical protein
MAKKKDIRINNDLQNIHMKLKDQVTRSSLKQGVNSGVPDGKAIPVPLVAPVVLLCSSSIYGF